MASGRTRSSQACLSPDGRPTTFSFRCSNVVLGAQCLVSGPYSVPGPSSVLGSCVRRSAGRRTKDEGRGTDRERSTKHQGLTLHRIEKRSNGLRYTRPYLHYTPRMRLSRDWWAVLAAAAAIFLIKLGLLGRIAW